MEKTYDGVIVMCRNWRGYPFKHKVISKNGREKLDISVLSKMNCTIAANMYNSGRTEKIIIGSGKSAGEKWDSEAEAMKNYILRKYPEIDSNVILIQEGTLDTYSELDENLKLAKENKLERLALVTIESQLPRCKKVVGDEVDCFSTEEEANNISPRYGRIMQKYHSSLASVYESTKEFGLRVAQKVKFTEGLIKIIAKTLRK